MEVEEFNPEDLNQEMVFQIVCYLAEARNNLDEIKVGIIEKVK